MKSHEGSRIHTRACFVYEQWGKHGTVYDTVERHCFTEHTRGWNIQRKEISAQSLNCCQSVTDPVLQDLLRPLGYFIAPCGHGVVKYPSSPIQNKLFHLL